MEQLTEEISWKPLVRRQKWIWNKCCTLHCTGVNWDEKKMKLISVLILYSNNSENSLHITTYDYNGTDKHWTVGQNDIVSCFHFMARLEGNTVHYTFMLDRPLFKDGTKRNRFKGVDTNWTILLRVILVMSCPHLDHPGEELFSLESFLSWVVFLRAILVMSGFPLSHSCDELFSSESFLWWVVFLRVILVMSYFP